jgi:hypothetical protein
MQDAEKRQWIDALNRSLFKMPAHAVPAFDYLGWDPDVHVTTRISDRKEIRNIQRLINKYEADIIAWYCYQFAPGFFSLEIQMRQPIRMIDDLNPE